MNTKIEENKKQFIGLLKSTEREGIEKLIDFLEESDFFVAPASAKYHNAFDGGLCDHSLKVYRLLSQKVKMFEINIPESSIIIIALLHDLCKRNFYEVKECWRKDKNNKWENYPGYGYKEDSIPLGHGSKSVIMLQTFIKLTKTEVLSIFWHMGLSTNDDKYGFSEAAKQHPLVLLTHTADFEASYILETQGVQEDSIALKKS